MQTRLSSIFILVSKNIQIWVYTNMHLQTIEWTLLNHIFSEQHLLISFQLDKLKRFNFRPKAARNAKYFAILLVLFFFLKKKIRRKWMKDFWFNTSLTYFHPVLILLKKKTLLMARHTGRTTIRILKNIVLFSMSMLTEMLPIFLKISLKGIW